MHKCYPIHQSPLFKLRGIGRFESVLGVKLSAIDKLLKSDCYHVWTNNKGREIQHPIGWLKQVHKRIANLFSRIELPNYLYSIKGRSYIDNAFQHIGTKALIKTDIKSFYPNVTHQMVYQMFVHDFKCAKDIALHLANICCYKQEHLPTGSTLSGKIAFFATRKMFDEIEKLVVHDNDCKLTVYVDDITISGKNATTNLLSKVRKIIRNHGHKTKNKKSISFASTSPKTVTGIVIVDNELRLPNKRHHQLWLSRQALNTATNEEKFYLQRSLCGRLIEARQIYQKNKLISFTCYE